MVEQYLQWGAAASGFVSAALWLWSTIASVEVDPDDHGYIVSSEVRGKQIDFHRTVELQTKINRLAAAATGVAALLAAIALTIPS